LFLLNLYFTGKKVGPKKITTSCISLPFNPADNEGENESKSSSSQVIPWGDQSKSSFTFQRYFRYESTSSSTSTKSFDPLGINSKQQRYQPIICPIQLSLSRNGKMYQLGTASIYISGEEAGTSSMNVPITTTTSTSPFKKSNNNNNVTMKSIKGERNLKYGISSKATLRIVVTVSDPSSTLERISKALSFDNKQKEEEEENKKVVRIKEPTFLEFLCCMG